MSLYTIYKVTFVAVFNYKSHIILCGSTNSSVSKNVTSKITTFKNVVFYKNKCRNLHNFFSVKI